MHDKLEHTFINPKKEGGHMKKLIILCLIVVVSIFAFQGISHALPGVVMGGGIGIHNAITIKGERIDVIPLSYKVEGAGAVQAKAEWGMIIHATGSHLSIVPAYATLIDSTKLRQVSKGDDLRTIFAATDYTVIDKRFSIDMKKTAIDMLLSGMMISPHTGAYGVGGETVFTDRAGALFQAMSVKGEQAQMAQAADYFPQKIC